MQCYTQPKNTIHVERYYGHTNTHWGEVKIKQPNKS